MPFMRSMWGRAIVAAWLAVLSAPLSFPAQLAEPENQRLCLLRGKAINGVTGGPAAGVRLRLNRLGSALDRSSDRETVAGEQGEFSFQGIEPGSYRLAGQGSGFARSEYGAKGRPRQLGVTLRLLPGQEITNIEFRLTPTGVISGRVFDEKGKPLMHVEVGLLRPYYGLGRRMLGPAGMDRTNDLGEYRIFGITPGRYYLSATLRPWLGGVNQLAPSGDKKEEYVTMFYPAASNIDAALPVDVAPGQEVSGMDFRLEKEPVVRLSGRVVKPADAGTVTLWLTPEWLAGMPGRARTQASEDGQFMFPGVLPGTYAILAMGMSTLGQVSGKEVIDVDNEDLDDVVISVSRDVELRGVVRNEEEATLPDEIRRVGMVPWEKTGMTFAPVRPAKVGKDGTFTLANVGVDRYAVEVETLPEGYYVKALRIGDQDLLAEGVDGRAAWLPNATLEILLSPKAGRVEGIVTTEDDQPVAGATVVMIPESARKRQQLRFCPTVTTNQDGAFALGNVEPGEYKAYAWVGVETGIWMDPAFMKQYAGMGEEVTVREGGNESIWLKLLEGR